MNSIAEVRDTAAVRNLVLLSSVELSGVAEAKRWNFYWNARSEVLIVSDDDGIVIAEMPSPALDALASALKRARETAQRSGTSSRPALLAKPLTQLANGKARVVLQALVESVEPPSFNDLLNMTNMSRAQLEGVLGAITAVVRRASENRNDRLWEKRSQRYILMPGVKSEICAALEKSE